MKRTLVIVAVWAIVTALSAYIRVTNVLGSPGLTPGYETEWRFQLAMFGIVFFPFFLAALVIVLLIDRRLRKPASE